jgi:hypothetical protein
MKATRAANINVNVTRIVAEKRSEELEQIHSGIMVDVQATPLWHCVVIPTI